MSNEQKKEALAPIKKETSLVNYSELPEEVKQRLAFADHFYKAGCFTSDVKNAELAFVKIQAGAEMGLKPMESMNTLYIVNGHVTIFGTGLSKLLRENGWTITYEGDKTKCTATITKGKETHSFHADKQDMLDMKSKAYGFAPLQKLRWHCLGNLVRFHVPEVLGGSIQYIKEEAEDFEPERKVVEVEEPIRNFASIVEAQMPEMKATVFNKDQTSLTDELGY